MPTEPPKAAPPKLKRRWIQFSLRTLFVVVANAGANGGAGVSYNCAPADFTAGGLFIWNFTAISGSGLGKASYLCIGTGGG
jgi:hypothetical protein